MRSLKDVDGYVRAKRGKDGETGVGAAAERASGRVRVKVDNNN